MLHLHDFYGGKKVVVVGGAGMVGYKLVRELLRLESDVLVIDDFSRGRNIIRRARYEAIDVSKDSRELVEAMTGAFAVFNLAARVAGILHNESHHMQMYDDNVRVLAGPLRAAEQAGVPNFLQTSSVCIYAEEYQSPCLEENHFKGEPHAANAGYAESKRDGERMVHWSNIEHAVIVRPSNIIGDYDYFDDMAHVVPAFIKRAVEAEDNDVFQAYGAPLVQREFIYNQDVATGMLVALARGENREAYNIGTSGGDTDRRNVTTMLNLATRIIELVNYILGTNKELRIIFDNSMGGGDSLRYSNATKLRKLGWHNTTNLTSALSTAISYYITEVDGITQ